MQEVQQNNLGEEYTPRLLKLYREKIIDMMIEKFSYTNRMEIPKLTKIVVNMGVGQGINDAKLVERAANDLGLITGQTPKITRAKKPISNFKLKKGVAIGCCVVLRKTRMYEFLDRMITVAMPRIRDFRGISANAFDGMGNYTFGITEQTVFPEIDLDKVERTQGMNITICTSSETDEEARALLDFLGFPFRK
jgi:large subunit ribosomal protein L5